MTTNNQQPTTRHCFDPWNYLEFRPDGKVSPCCMQKSISVDANFDLNEIRNVSAFRNLREQLINGNLDDKCISCGLRDKVSLGKFKELFEEKFPNQSNFLEPVKQLEMVRIDITERCNLRCTYCAVSQPNYKGIDDDSGTGVIGGREFPAKKLDQLINSLSLYNEIKLIAVNGHGETTYYKNWHVYCGKLVDAGHNVTIISNFARIFESIELDTLARFQSISLSLDTVDEKTLKVVRRKVELSNIVKNIDSIRQRAAELNTQGPKMDILSGVFDKNVLFLPQLAQFAVDKKFTGITFWKLLKYPNINVEGDVLPIDQLNTDEIVNSLNKVDEAKNILVKNGLSCHFTSNFIEEIRKNFSDFVTLKSLEVTHEPGIFNVFIISELADSESLRKKLLFLVLSVDGRLFYLLPSGEIEPCDVLKIDEYYFHSEISVKMQLHSILIPYSEKNDRNIILYVAMGASLREIVENRRYVTYVLLDEHSAVESSVTKTFNYLLKKKHELSKEIQDKNNELLLTKNHAINLEKNWKTVENAAEELKATVHAQREALSISHDLVKNWEARNAENERLVKEFKNSTSWRISQTLHYLARWTRKVNDRK